MALVHFLESLSAVVRGEPKTAFKTGGKIKIFSDNKNREFASNTIAH